MSHSFVHDELMTSAETAALLSIKPNTLEIWRSRGRGPSFLKLSDQPQGPVRYERATVMQWLAERSYASTSAYSAAGLLNRTPQGCRSIGASV